MQNRVKIYTRNGDNGETSLCNGSRTPKDSFRVKAYGTVDELNSFLGLCILRLEDPQLKEQLQDIQKELLAIGANLAYPADLSQSIIKGESLADKIPKINEETIFRMEERIDSFDKELPALKHFILCGGTETAALLHIARTVCRRAEREIVSLKNHEEINKNVLKYMNRLSDYLFTIARVASHRAGKDDIKWMPGQGDLKKYSEPQSKLR